MLSDTIKELSILLGGTAAAVIAMAWLARSIVLHFLSKDIAKHKAELDAQSQLETERLRAELVKQSLEHEVKFRRVDEHVAEHISKVYQLLFAFYQAVSSYVSAFEFASEPSKEEKLTIASQANRAFNDYLLPNRLYIPPPLFDRIKIFSDKLTAIANDFTSGLKREKRGVETPEDADHWSKAFTALKEEANPLFTDLVAAFQKRLGVED